MNKKRRAKIEALIVHLEDIQGQIEELKDEEQEYLDGIPDAMTSKRQWAEKAVEDLDEAFEAIYQVTAPLSGAAADQE